jgi:hypothetical protein
MERDELIIWVYLWVCEEMEQWQQSRLGGPQRLRRAGFDPALTDEEVLCIELCGEMLRLHHDKAIYQYFRLHYQDWFPNLRDRPAFVRHCANLWRIKLILHQRLLRACHVGEDLVQPVDTMPLPVCAKVRAHRDWNFAEVARKTKCAVKEQFYYGFKLGLRVTRCGFISHYALLYANTHDTRHLSTLVEGHEGYVPVDKGFFFPWLWRKLEMAGLHIVGRGPRPVHRLRPPELALPAQVEKACARIRKTVEVVGSLLCSRFRVDHIRVHDLWHFEHRLLRKILAFNLLVALNISLGRPSLDLDGLVQD